MERQEIKKPTIEIERIKNFGVPQNLIETIQKFGEIIDVEIVGDFCYVYLKPTVTIPDYLEDKYEREEWLNEFISNLPPEFTTEFAEYLVWNMDRSSGKSPLDRLIIFKSKYKRSETKANKIEESVMFSVYTPLGLDIDEFGRPVKI